MSRFIREFPQKPQNATTAALLPEPRPDFRPPFPSISPEAIQGTLADTVLLLKRFIVFPSEAAYRLLALWVAHTYVIEAFEYTPYLHVYSPEKQCGKSRVLEVLFHLVSKPWKLANPSEAALFRKIEKDCPTVLWDEIDAVFQGKATDPTKENLRGLVNSGFERNGRVPRCDGAQHEVKDYSVFCPKVLAGIGELPDTIADRCIPIRLERKKKSQETERFRGRDAAQITEPLRLALHHWAQNSRVIDTLSAARPEIPKDLGDRQADIAEPLIAIADLLGGEWPEFTRRGLLELFKVGHTVTESDGSRLLRDIRQVFEESGLTRISTATLITKLVELGGPWAERWAKDLQYGNLNGPAGKLARLLREYGICSKTLSFTGEPDSKGYLEEVFMDAWERYL
jgi:hypothetical protein